MAGSHVAGLQVRRSSPVSAGSAEDAGAAHSLLAPEANTQEVGMFAMRLKVSKSKTLPIGLDLGSSVVKLAQLTRRQDALELSAAVALELPVDIRDNADKRMAYLTDQ